MSTAKESESVGENITVKTDQPTLFIGTKPLMAYVTSALIQLANNNRLFVRARGNSIGRAVDIAQIIVRKMERAGFSITDIKVGSEELISNDNKKRQVSFISLEITKELK